MRQKTKISPSQFGIAGITLLVLFVFFHKHRYLAEDRVIEWDVISYYAYLPATFIYKDINLDFVGNYDGPHKYLIWYDLTEDGDRFLRYTMGLAIMYSPFFALGHLSAHLLGYDPGGYSVPYKFFLQFGGIIYFIIGLFLLRKLLLKFFDDKTTLISLIAVALGTNLFHYATIEIPMPHMYNFVLITLFLLLTLQWHQNPNLKNSIYVGLVTGLITLVRPFDGIIVVFFILHRIYNITSLKSKIILFLTQWKYIVVIILATLIVLFPQFLYWKKVTGHWFFYTYGVSGGSFYFDNPQIINGLLSFRKGWFLYTPVMVFSVLGMFFIRRNLKEFTSSVILFTVILIYLIFSWWSWWYGGGISIRSLVEFYPVFLIPLALFLKKILAFRIQMIKISVLIIFIFACFLGFFHNFQYDKGILHFDSMTKEAYKAIFLKLKYPPNYRDLLCKPDYDLARKGIYICHPYKKLNQ